MINSIWVRGAKKSPSFTFVTAVLTAAFLMGGFFVAPNAALAAHTATVTVDPTLVKGGEASTYTFDITNNGPDAIYRVIVTIPSGFSGIASASCPTGMTPTEVSSTQVTCLGDTFEAGTQIANGASAQLSFSATSPTPGSDTLYTWQVSTRDTTGTSVANTSAETTVDVTVPTITSITTKDADADGGVDTATIVFSEPVDDSTFVLDDFTIGGVAATAINTGTADDNTFDVVVTGGVAGTEAKEVTYTQGTGADIAGNLLANVVDGTIVEVDGANPVLLSAQTKTTTTIDLTFSEDLNGATVTNADFSIAGFTLDSGTDAFETSPGVVRLTTTAPFGTGETPAVSYTGMVEDLASNIASTAGPITPSDGVAPTFTAQTLTTTTIELTFSENVDGGTAADAWTVDGDPATAATDPAGGTTLTLTVAVMDTGDTPEVVYVAANGDIADTATNEVADGTSDMAEDGIAPTVVISSTATSPTNTSPIPMTVTFSEDVTGFEIGDIVVVNGTKADFVAVNDSTYTFNVTPTDQGAVTVDIAGGVAQDAVANNNTVATQFSIVFDDVEPDAPVIVSIATNELINNAEKTAIVVEGTAEANSLVTVVLSDGTNSVMNTEQLSGGDTTFSITLDGTSAAPSALIDGIIVPSVTATDAAGNVSVAAITPTATQDTVAPATPAITSIADDSFINNAEKAAIHVVGTAEDGSTVNVSLTGGATVMGSGTATGGNFDITIDGTTLTDGTIAPSVTATDAAGNVSAADTDPTAIKDVIVPTVTLASTASPGPTNDSPIPMTVTFSEDVTGFDLTDITVINGSKADFVASSGLEYTFNVTPTADGLVTVSVAADKAIDVAENNNTAATDFTITYDSTPPTVEIVLADFALKAGETSLVTFTFSEAVTGFGNADITTIENGTLTPVGPVDGGVTWTATFTPTADTEEATNIITVDTTGVEDLAGNAGVGTTDSENYTIDTLRPTVTAVLTDSDLIAGETTEVTFTFSEVPTDFNEADVTVESGAITGAMIATIDPLVFTATLTPIPDVEDAINILTVGTSWADPAGNAPAGGTDSANYTVETKKPSVVLTSATADPTNGLIAVTAEFSEAVTGFDDTDVTVANGEIENFAGVGTSYTFDVNPTDGASIAVTIEVSADKAIDAVGNNNTASNQLAYTSDTVVPTVALTYDPDRPVKDTDTITITATFNETLGGTPTIAIDTQGDGDLGAMLMSATLDPLVWTYDWDVPAGADDDGTATMTIAAQDLAGNPNAAATNETRTIDNTPPSAEETTLVTNPTNDTTPSLTITVENDISWEIKNGATVLALETGTGAGQEATLSALADGSYTLDLVATDEAENVTTTPLTPFLVDSTEPTVDAGAGKTTNILFTQEATATDGGSGIATYAWTQESGPGTITFGTAGTEDTTITADADGTYEILLTVTDNAGNVASDEMILVWDTEEPMFDSVAVSDPDAFYKAGDTISFDVDLGETGLDVTVDLTSLDSALSSAFVLSDNDDGTYSGTTLALSAGTLIEGIDTAVTITATDTAGNTTDDSTLLLTIDNTAPVLVITAPLSGVKVSGDETITFTNDEATAPECSVDGATYISCASGVTTLGDVTGFGALPEGAFTLSVRDADTAGNIGTDSEAGIIKDSMVPSITGKTPGANAVGIDPSTNITITFNEDVLVEDADVAITPGNPAKTISFVSETGVATINPDSDLDDNTTYTITLNGVTDTAGNELPETSWSFTTAASYSIDLTTGWNLISLPVVPVDTDASAVLGDLDDVATIQSVFTYDALTGEWLVYHPDSPETSDFSTMNTGNGYWIDYLAIPAGTIAGTGNLFLEGASTPPQKELAAGWNLIGYYQLEDTTDVAADAALSTVDGQWTQLRTYDNMLKQFQSVTGVDTMSPGQGYWIFMKSSTIGTYMYGPGDAS